MHSYLTWVSEQSSERVDRELRSHETGWDRKVQHFDRKVNPAAYGRFRIRGQLLKAKITRRRGLPSRNVPLEVVLERLQIELTSQVLGTADWELVRGENGRIVGVRAVWTSDSIRVTKEFVFRPGAGT